jgi:hypothetical protein
MEEGFFVDRSQGLFDAMPAVWKKLSPENRLTVVNRIDTFHAEASPGQSAWVKDNVLQLTKYIPLDQIPNIRACYMATKIDPSVVHRVEGAQPHTEEDLDEPSFESDLTALDAFQLKPPSLMSYYMPNKMRAHNDQDDTIKNDLLKHMTNFAARQSWKAGTMAPSAHLNVEVTKDQEELLNPSPCNMIMGFVMYDVKGKGAKKRMAKRRLNVIDANIASYCRVLKSTERMIQITEANEVAAVLAEIEEEKDSEKKKCAEKMHNGEPQRKLQKKRPKGQRGWQSCLQ